MRRVRFVQKSNLSLSLLFLGRKKLQRKRDVSFEEGKRIDDDDFAHKHFNLPFEKFGAHSCITILIMS